MYFSLFPSSPKVGLPLNPVWDAAQWGHSHSQPAASPHPLPIPLSLLLCLSCTDTEEIIQTSIRLGLLSLLFHPASCFLIPSQSMEEKRGYREREREAGRKAVKKNSFCTWMGSLLPWLGTSKEETGKPAKFILTSTYWTLMLGSEDPKMIKTGSLPSGCIS